MQTILHVLRLAVGGVSVLLWMTGSSGCLGIEASEKDDPTEEQHKEIGGEQELVGVLGDAILPQEDSLTEEELDNETESMSGFDDSTTDDATPPVDGTYSGDATGTNDETIDVDASFEGTNVDSTSEVATGETSQGSEAESAAVTTSEEQSNTATEVANFDATTITGEVTQVEVRLAGARLAVFTVGASSAVLEGPLRTFREVDTLGQELAVVSHNKWVRTLPRPFREFGEIEQMWLENAISANERLAPDVLELALQYVGQRPSVFEGAMRVAGDADYGPLIGDTRQEGSDFNDFLGIAWKYGTYEDAPEAEQNGALDCSGFIRMVWGYRLRERSSDSIYPLGLVLNASVVPENQQVQLPRRALLIGTSGPGLLIADQLAVGSSEAALARLQVGDLVFFDTDPTSEDAYDHVGMYVGNQGSKMRFVSSRKKANGPTMGDVGGTSVLNGCSTCLYTRTFRAIRRP